jgi:sugar (pentulose or hexulose) kinase
MYIKVTHTYIPDPENRTVYDRSYNEFKKLYKQNASSFKALNS